MEPNLTNSVERGINLNVRQVYNIMEVLLLRTPVQALKMLTMKVLSNKRKKRKDNAMARVNKEMINHITQNNKQ